MGDVAEDFAVIGVEGHTDGGVLEVEIAGRSEGTVSEAGSGEDQQGEKQSEGGERFSGGEAPRSGPPAG